MPIIYLHIIKQYQLGPSHNYYEGREETDITPWVEYFCAGLVHSFERVKVHALKQKIRDCKILQINYFGLMFASIKHYCFLRKKMLSLLKMLKKHLKFNQELRVHCVNYGFKKDFLYVVNPSKKNRIYSISPSFLHY